MSRTSAPPFPLYGLLSAYAGLLGAPVAVTIRCLRRCRLLLLPPSEQLPDGADQLPAIQEEDPPRNWGILDAKQVGVAAAAIRSSISRNIVRSHGHLRYAPIHDLEAVPDVRLLDPNSMEGMIRELPPAAATAVEMLRRASIHYGPIDRLPNVVRDPSILNTDPYALATESTKMVIELKTTTILVCLIWRELNGQNWQLCQEVKEEWFALVTRPSVENLLAIARSFSNANWCSCHVTQVLTIFDTLAYVLYNIQGLPLDRSHEVADISNNMMEAIRGMLKGTTDDIDSSEESAVHPANGILMQALGFLHEKQSMLGTGDPCSDMFNYWVSKLEADAELIFQDEKDRRYIFLFNNACYAWQMMRRPGESFSNVELLSRLISMIQRYKKSYFHECWVPLIMSNLEGDSLKKPCSLSLDKFIAKFVIICDRQMTWKVPAELKYKLRKDIVDTIVPPYEVFLHALQANPSKLSEVFYWLKRIMRGKKKSKEYTVEQLEMAIVRLFES